MPNHSSAVVTCDSLKAIISSNDADKLVSIIKADYSALRKLIFDEGSIESYLEVDEGKNAQKVESVLLNLKWIENDKIYLQEFISALEKFKAEFLKNANDINLLEHKEFLDSALSLLRSVVRLNELHFQGNDLHKHVPNKLSALLSKLYKGRCDDEAVAPEFVSNNFLNTDHASFMQTEIVSTKILLFAKVLLKGWEFAITKATAEDLQEKDKLEKIVIEFCKNQNIGASDKSDKTVSVFNQWFVTYNNKATTIVLSNTLVLLDEGRALFDAKHDNRKCYFSILFYYFIKIAEEVNCLMIDDQYKVVSNLIGLRGKLKNLKGINLDKCYMDRLENELGKAFKHFFLYFAALLDNEKEELYSIKVNACIAYIKACIESMEEQPKSLIDTAFCKNNKCDQTNTVTVAHMFFNAHKGKFRNSDNAAKTAHAELGKFCGSFRHDQEVSEGSCKKANENLCFLKNHLSHKK